MKLTQFRTRLEELGDLDDLGTRIGKQLVRVAEDISPVRTGKFSSAWSFDLDSSDTEIVVRLLNSAPYGTYADQGYGASGAGSTKSKYWKGKPYSLRAFLESEDEIRTLIQQALRN